MPIVQQPEVYLASVKSLLDDEGQIVKPETRDFLQSAIDEFVHLLHIHQPAVAAE